MAEKIRDFRDLLVWQKAIELSKSIYVLTKQFPADERFGLTNQIRRASVSVSSNIAEGHCRTTREFRSFLSIARGSAAEIESQLVLALELGFVEHSAIERPVSLCREIKRMTATLIRKLTTS